MEDNLCEIGVEAFLSEKNNYKNFMVAKSVHDAIFIMINKGIKMPKNLIIHCDEVKNIFPSGTDNMAYSDVNRYGTMEICFNTPKYKISKKFPFAIHKQGDPSVYNARMDTYHEVAHCKHAENDIELYLARQNKNFDKKTKREISRCINDYASADHHEFVAEYFAYKIGGIKILQSIIDFEKLYLQCKGAQLPKLGFWA